ncbi:hypothetical protein BC936DRAFT_138084 [Jimgerdemannia flammicorona]|uniref:Uncharacterized protein n=1 Tax=Jimgerdemannia flammicorona TaxID=994334 RepID=A0A433CW67_9FUNG|nr:hypothetical protein BC936DRAFT_138084 [Jimgerdemannia flammicorona]
MPLETYNEQGIYPGYSCLIEYLEQNDSWSYLEFLRLYRERLLNVGPFSDDWTALDSTWRRRFQRELKERGKDISKVRSMM